MTSGDQPAFPELHIHHFMTDDEGKEKPTVVPRWMSGMSKREFFAAIALHALLINNFDDDAVVCSLKYADSLIELLNK
jgi:hypothetical protein